MLDEMQKMASSQSWGIREFAEMFEVTPRTIRFYEDKGLLSPARDAGARVFDAEDYLRFEKIMRGKRLGFTLDDIKAVMDVTDGRISDRAELLRRKDNFETVIRSLGRRREDIEILAKDMRDICAVIDSHLDTTPDTDGVFDLAAAYEAKFRQTLYEGSAADDYSTDMLELPR